MNFEIFPSLEAGSVSLARRIASLVRGGAENGRSVVLGMATGKSPLFLYRELVRMHREEDLSFAGVVTFNLDEYFGLTRDDPRSYWRFMHDHLFDHVDIPARNIHIPDGTVAFSEIDGYCREYDRMIHEAGGIDLQILGIGRTGHIGFNEPGAGRDSRTALVRLDNMTRMDAAADFGGLANVPEYAITMGCGTILRAREIALMGWGEGKAGILGRAFGDPVSNEVPASYLQEHAHATVYLDKASASGLFPHPVSEKHHVLND